MKSDLKILFFCILVICIIITSGVLIKSFLKKTTLKFNNDINKTQSYITSGDWKNANRVINNLNTSWKTTEDKWALFINHREIDNIYVSLDNAMEYIKYKRADHASAYLTQLKHFFDHIPDMEKLSLKNIL